MVFSLSHEAFASLQNTSSPAAEQQNKQYNNSTVIFSQISELLINTNMWVFFVLPNALKTFDCCCSLSSFVLSARPFLFTSICTHILHVPATGNVPEEWRRTCVYSSLRVRGPGLHPEMAQLGFPGLSAQHRGMMMKQCSGKRGGLFLRINVFQSQRLFLSLP